MDRGRPRIISLFSGAGGLDYGFEAAGFSTRVAVEVDHDSCETLRVNRPKLNIIERSIFDVAGDEVLSTARLAKGEADVLIGGPPCQPFSKSGFWARGRSLRLEDERARTLDEYFRIVRATVPRVFVLENVSGFSSQGRSEALQLIDEFVAGINRSQRVSYRVTHGCLRAVEHGVPQRRERLFIVAHRGGRRFTFPEPTHGQPDEEGIAPPGLEPYRTAWDALATISNDVDEVLRLSGKWADLIPSIPEGENYLWHTSRGGGRSLFGWRTRYWSFLLKLAKRLPSWTLQANPGPATGPFHWDNRLLSRRELAALQTFPADVEIVGSRHSAQRQLGNAVPSLLAEVLAREIRVQLLDLPRKRGTPRLLPPCQGDPPPPARVRPVLKKYWHLEKDHADHPGKHLGPRAQALWAQAAE